MSERQRYHELRYDAHMAAMRADGIEPLPTGDYADMHMREAGYVEPPADERARGHARELERMWRYVHDLEQQIAGLTAAMALKQDRRNKQEPEKAWTPLD